MRVLVNTFDEYETEAMRFSVYPRVTRLQESAVGVDVKTVELPYVECLPVYPALAMMGEVSELAAKVADLDWSSGNPLPQSAYIKELGDVLWYLTAAARDLGFSMRFAAVSQYRDVTTLSGYARELNSCANDLKYWTLHLVAKAGEFSEQVKKAWRDGDPLNRRRAAESLRDVFADLARIARLFYSDIAEVAQVNIDKIVGRRDRGTLAGSGDDR